MIKKFITYTFLFAIAYLSFWSCIEPYDLPNVANDFVPSIVIDANLNNEDSLQTISVSQTRPLNSPLSNSINPLSGCIIQVTDKDAHVFNFVESDQAGYYHCTIAPQYFYAGNTFKLHMTTSNDEVYESEEEKLLPVPEVDSIYFVSVLNGEAQETGIQFKIDVKGTDNDSRNYKWKLFESYEYHATFPIHLIYRGPNDVEERDHDMSQYYCYKTYPISGNIYMLSTDKLSENRFIGKSLNYVSHSSNKLKYKYSLLVKQYSLTEGASRFWSQMEDNQEKGGMFDGQPITVEGNIWNTNNTDERVLGYFSASMVSQKRVFVTRSSNFNTTVCYQTTLSDLELDSLISVSSGFNPLYVVKYYGAPGEIIEQFTAKASCFDCTIRGGSTSKPAYWEDESIPVLIEPVDE